MALDKFDAREAERYEQEYQRQLMLLKSEVDQLDADARTIPKEIEETRKQQRDLETRLRTVRSDLSRKRKELDDMVHRHEDMARKLSRH